MDKFGERKVDNTKNRQSSFCNNIIDYILFDEKLIRNSFIILFSMAKMGANNVLIIGAGAREHSIAWKLEASPFVGQIFIAPGNACKYSVDEKLCGQLQTIDGVRNFCITNSISLLVIGPEKEICAGWADELADVCMVFAPSRDGAKLEASKSFAKQFMIENQLPTASFKSFKDAKKAIDFVNSLNWKRMVIKEDGLCAGKGVYIFDEKVEAILKIKNIFSHSSEKNTVVIEEFLDGYEVSAMCFTDGKTVSRIPLSQDHKRLLENDMGANTGGMGAIAPIIVSRKIDEQISHILQTTIDALQKNKTPYKGILYAGLMITRDGPKLLEYNCRFGDPETEVLLPLLESDLFELMRACCTKTLADYPVKWAKKFSVGIVVASKGYPQSFPTGLPITELPEDSDFLVTFYAGAKFTGNNTLINSGGRVLCVTCVDVSPFKAKSNCLKAVESINFEIKQYRRDIGNFVLSPRESLNYSKSGVSVDEGNAFVDGIKDFCKLTLTPGTEQIGGFGAVVDLKAGGFNSNPQLVIGMDGIGTKLEVASRCENFDSLGFDLVGMCANDVLCHCAKPVAFLDYYVTGKLERKKATKVVKSIAKACIEAECALIGGETAEMPGVYHADQWDVAGCCIGAREENWPKLPLYNKIKSGDLLIGLASNGVHSNGFSLVRKIIDENGFSLNEACPWIEHGNGNSTKCLGYELLRPTKIYVKSLLELSISGHILAMAHITGGGIIENLPRCLPKNMMASIDCRSWQPCAVFNWLKYTASISSREMLKTFNCGIGMILVISPISIDKVRSSLNKSKTEFYEIGHVMDRGQTNERVHFDHIENLFSYTFDLSFVHRPRINVAVLISGNGSNMVELIRQSRKRNSHCFISIIISNKPDVGGIELARSYGIEAMVVPSQGKTRHEFETEVSKELKARNVDLICLAGFMRLLTSDFICDGWQNRIINVHPSLLPSFKGAHAVRLAIESGVKFSGCTVHYVVEDVDAGEIIAQECVQVSEDDDENSLHKKIQAKEHLLFPKVMEEVSQKILLEK